MLEHEIRFSVAPSARESVGVWFSGAAATHETCETLYFDTDTCALRKAGIELRVRRIEGHFIQTIKTSESASGSTWVRQEHETPIASFEPSMIHLLDNLPNGTSKDTMHVPLRPIFETHLKRTRVRQERSGGVVESVFDEGHILATGRSRTVLEVEHELKNGPPSNLAASCIEFLNRSPCPIGVEGKAARGYRLLLNRDADPVFQKRLRIEPTTPLPEAVYQILTGNLNHALANLPALADTGVAGSIHQMRVGFRRLRSAMSAFAPILAGPELRRLAAGTKPFFALLGDVRDADVFLTDTLPSIPTHILPTHARRLLVRHVSAHRAHALAALQRHLAGDEFSRFVVFADAWIEGRDWFAGSRPIDQLLTDRPINEFAAARLREMHRKFIKLGRRATAGTLDDWHKVRIMSKKLRYSGEPLLATLREEGASDYAKNLSRLQAKLGHINDAHNVRAFLDRVRPAVPARSRAGFAEAAAYCIGWGAASAEAAVRAVAQGWHAFETTSRTPECGRT